MALTFHNPALDISFVKQNTTYTRSNLPFFFQSISAVEMSLIGGQAGNISIELTPSFKDGLKILKSGLLGFGASLLNEMPEKQDNNKSASSISSGGQVSKPNGSKNDLSKIQPQAGDVFLRLFWPNQDLANGSPASTLEYKFSLYQPEIDLNNTDFNIKLKGVSTAAKIAGVTTQASFAENTSVFNALIDLLTPLNITIDFDDSDQISKSILTSNRIYRAYTGTVWQIVDEILDEFRCYKILQDDVIIVKSQEGILKQKPKMVFVFLRNIDTSASPPVYPILSYSWKSKTPMFSDPRIFGGKKLIFNQDTKEFDTDVFTIEDSESNSPADQGAEPLEDDKLSGSSYIVIETGNITNEKKAERDVTKTLQNQIEVNITAPGIPDILPYDLVGVVVEDSIPALSGLGVVQSISHRYDTGSGWETTFKVVYTGGTQFVKSFVEKPVIKTTGEPSKSLNKTATVIV